MLKQSDIKPGGKRGKSISKKISLGVLAILIPSFIVMIVVACLMAASTISLLNQEKLAAQTENAVSIVDGFFENKIAAVKVISVNPEIQNFLRNARTITNMNDYEEKADLLGQMKDIIHEMSDEKVRDTWVMNLGNGQVLLSTGNLVDGEMENITWDDDLLRTKKPVVCDPYDDPITGENIISIVAPVFSANGSAIVGAVGMDISISDLDHELKGIKVGKAGYMELLSTDSVYIVSDDPSAVGRNVTELDIEEDYKDKMKSRYEGIMTFSYGGVSYRALSRISESTNWLAVATLPQAEIDATRNQLIVTLLSLSVLILVGLVFVIVFLIRRTLKPLTEVGSIIQEFAGGNLNVEIEVKSDDEIGQLAMNVRGLIETLRFIIEDLKYIMNEMASGNFRVRSKNLEYYKGDYNAIVAAMRDLRDRMNRTLIQIDQSAEQVSAGSDQVSSGAQALSQGATEQASSVEELAAAINEISSQVKTSAANAQEASGRAAAVGDEMTECNQKMQDLMGAMRKISGSSGEIGKIIKTIEDIAFQTNILALNAAVEAARAGAAGKGFAVVADEVRNLASKSAEASKNTAVLIEDSIIAVEEGTRIADDTAKALSASVKGAKEVIDSIDRISDASNEQAGSIAQVTQGVDQISSVVQTNSATAEESAAASEELSGQAQTLKGLVSQFMLMESEE